ncbi:VOC family protein [Phenylobacterium sp.]|uniref:VOC family protein n=1 Tax=Phenylobacterium sp. TaxID=1871053 RepID=UPI00260B428C|nr:VOC family protein [Phenylobacterium sp.]
MRLQQTRLVTSDVPRLTAFYEAVTGASKGVATDAYVEFASPAQGLAIAGGQAGRVYGEGVVAPAQNRSAILDFEVADVDAEYERLRPIVADWVMAPTVMPWGNRVIVFRDPDGNLINMFAPAD